MKDRTEDDEGGKYDEDEDDDEGDLEEQFGQEWAAQRAQEGLERASMLRNCDAKCSGEVSDQIVTSISGIRLPMTSSLGAKKDNQRVILTIKLDGMLPKIQISKVKIYVNFMGITQI